MTKLERIILNTSLLRFLIIKSKRIVLPGFEKAPLYDVIVFFFSQVKKVGITDRAAAISFNFLMAIPAGTIFLFTLIPYVPISEQIVDELLVLTRDISPNANTYKLVNDFLVDFLKTPRSGLLSIGFVVAVYYASNAVIGIMRSFNKSLLHSNKRNFFEDRWMAVKLTTILVLLIMASVLLLITQGELSRLIFEWMDIQNAFVKWLLNALRWFVIIALVFYSIAIIYKYAPAIHKRFKLSSPGAIFATFLIVTSTYLFSYWVNHFASYNKVYGSIGTILIIMFLVYLNSLILLIGYELNVSIHSIKAMADERHKHEIENALKAAKS